MLIPVSSQIKNQKQDLKNLWTLDFDFLPNILLVISTAGTYNYEHHTQNLMELIERTKETFRFKYVGGGYFRDKSIPRGEKAEVRHGEEILDEFCQELIKRSQIEDL